jgi:NAD-dependent deacetylase
LVDSNPTAADFTRAVHLLREAQRTVALTGAGISTPSGVPDFRSPGTGLWERYDPMEVASLSVFRHHPQQFYEWIRPLAKHILQAEPNPAHLALARLEQAGRLVGVVTQNIDDLHSRAGSRQVLEVHGHLREATCVRCYRSCPSGQFMPAYTDSGEVPLCPECGGILKPNAVLYGEQLPYDVVRQAREWILSSDLILVIGSSLEVAPAATFPVEALNAGARLIILNREPTYLDERAEVIFRQDVAEILPQLVDEALHV